MIDEWLGFGAAALTTASFLPQAWMTFRTRDASGISLAMYGAFTLGIALWLAYGIRIGAWPLIIGYWNVGAYSRGMMVPTPSIDRIASEGMLFTDHYAEPSCTAGRAAFITGQMPIRTGLTTVGQPGDRIGISEKDPTLAEVLKKLGYRTGQFGKNHLGDRNEFLRHSGMTRSISA